MPAHSATHRESFWRDLIARRESLRLSVNEVCREADVSPSSFYHWQQKLRAGRRPGTVNAPPAVPLVPVRIVDDRVMELRLELPYGVSIHVPHHDQELVFSRVLRAVLSACREAASC